MLLATVLLATTAMIEPPVPENWCRAGQYVIIPDGRDGPVTAVSGEFCRVLVYGEKYVTLWPYYLIEPAYPIQDR